MKLAREASFINRTDRNRFEKNLFQLNGSRKSFDQFYSILRFNSFPLKYTFRTRVNIFVYSKNASDGRKSWPIDHRDRPSPLVLDSLLLRVVISRQLYLHLSYQFSCKKKKTRSPSRPIHHSREKRHVYRDLLKNKHSFFFQNQKTRESRTKRSRFSFLAAAS